MDNIILTERDRLEELLFQFSATLMKASQAAIESKKY